jgi:GR25 family glycosyltransferase involved in LPS biosynthesis
MQEMIQKNYNAIVVVQDDVVFCPNFLDKLQNVMNNLPENAEMINFGLYKEACFQHFVAWDFVETHHCEPVNKYVGRLKAEFNPCSLGYILTKQGATNIVNHLTKYGFRLETDHVFNCYLRRKHIMYFPNEVLATGNVHLASDIFSNFR